MLKGNVKLTGSLAIAVNGDVVREIKNLVVDAGKEHVTARLKDNTSDNVMSHMAVGTTATAAAAGDTTLGGEVAASRTAFDAGFPDVSGTNTIVFETTFAAGVGTGALTEAGLFNAATNGTMLARTVFSTVNKGANDTMTITWTVTAS